MGEARPQAPRRLRPLLVLALAAVLVAGGCGQGGKESRVAPPKTAGAPDRPPPAEPKERSTLDRALADLSSDDVERRMAAAERFAKGELPAARAVEALVRALSDESRYVRDPAATALGLAGQAAIPAVPALIHALRDPDSFVRWHASRSLAGIGPPARAALPELKIAAAANDETALGHYWAVEAIKRIQGE